MQRPGGVGLGIEDEREANLAAFRDDIDARGCGSWAMCGAQDA
jgi:hypothetical protein